MHDANTVRRIVGTAGLRPDDVVLEIGPGLGSLTLALLPACRAVVAVEVDPVLAGRLPVTVAERAPKLAHRLRVLPADALTITERQIAAFASQTAAEASEADAASLPQALARGGPADARTAGSVTPAAGMPTALVANLPYNVAVPIVLHLLAQLPSLAHGLVMVQAEVADRMAASPGSRVYGVPSVKAAWFAQVRRAGKVSRSVFWPVPNVDSALVSLHRRPPVSQVPRAVVFSLVDAAFAQRRKTLRAALSGWAGSPDAAGRLLAAAGVPDSARGEQLCVADFARVAEAAIAAGLAQP